MGDYKNTLWGIAARVGVQEYSTEKAYRSYKEVLKSKTSLKNVPVTLGHISDIKTEKYKQVGVVTDTYFDNSTGLLLVLLAVSDLGIHFINERGFNQISVGYSCDPNWRSGSWFDTLGVTGKKGKQYAYDYEQKNIICDHLALCTKARAGAVAGVFTTGLKEGKTMLDNQEESPVQTLLLGLQTGMAKLNLEVDKLLSVQDSITELKSNVLVLQDSLDTVSRDLQTQDAVIEGSLETTPVVDIQKEIGERLRVSKVLGDSVDLTLSAEELKRQALSVWLSEADSKVDSSKLTLDSVDVCFDLVADLKSKHQKKDFDTTGEADSSSKESKLKNIVVEDSLLTNSSDRSTTMAARISEQRKNNRKN
jgi:hypothetical protein